jgi:hypothetical protein
MPAMGNGAIAVCAQCGEISQWSAQSNCLLKLSTDDLKKLEATKTKTRELSLAHQSSMKIKTRLAMGEKDVSIPQVMKELDAESN